MRFEWNENKNAEKIRKHGLSFGVARRFFDHPDSLTSFDRVIGDEERWQIRGYLGAVLILVVSTERIAANVEQNYRLLSARKATNEERRDFVRRRSPGTRLDHCPA